MKWTAANRLWCGGLCSLLLVSCGQNPASKPPESKAATARPVQVVRVEARTMERVATVTGTLAAREHSTLSAKVSGRLQQIAVDVGSVVREGDLIAQVEPRDYDLRLQQAAAALAQARAALSLPLEGEVDRVDLEALSAVKEAKAVFEEANKNRERVMNLAKAGIAPQSELDSVEAAFVVAATRYQVALDDSRTRMAALAERRAAFDLAKKQLADAGIRAPFDGTIQSRPANPGEYVATGSPIVHLVKIDPLRLRLEVPERNSSLIETNQRVRVAVEGFSKTFDGQITRLSPALDEATRMLLVEADVPSQEVLRPGLFARAQIIVDPGEQGLSIPNPALLVFAGIEKIVTVQNGQALEKTVTTGRRGADWVEITHGLAIGDAVVLNPAGLRTGQPVLIAPAEKTSQTARIEPVANR